MDIRDIKELIEVLKSTEYNYIDIKHEGSHILLSKEAINLNSNKNKDSHSIETAIITKSEVKSENLIVNDEENCYVVKSPIVGVFYSAPAPNEDDFVKLGDKIKKGETLCIVEAMKLMNEIDCEVEGEIVDILVSNEAVVEYGQPLFKIKVQDK